jgi:Cof subfamily protein (haloacid dehalogenase superfamily)
MPNGGTSIRDSLLGILWDLVLGNWEFVVLSSITKCRPRLPTAPALIRLLALDIDGTLVNSRDELTPATRQALGRAAAAGVRLVLATGRRYSRALPLVEPLGIDAPLVTASGALIKHPDGHRTLYRARFDPGALRRTLEVVAAAGYEAVLYADTYHAGFDFYCPRLEVEQAELADYLALNAGFGVEHPPLMTDPPEGVFSGFAVGNRARMVALMDELTRQLPDDLDVHVLRSPRYIGHMCEISPAGNTKWSGVRHVAQAWGIADDEICAVGDDVNDIPMITGAGLGVAMGNALDEVKAAADRVAPGHDQDGLVRVVDWILGS